MSARSSSGAWAVVSGGRLIGPFDGRSPATAFARMLRRQGYDARLERLWSEREARGALRRSPAGL